MEKLQLKKEIQKINPNFTDELLDALQQYINHSDYELFINELKAPRIQNSIQKVVSNYSFQN